MFIQITFQCYSMLSSFYDLIKVSDTNVFFRTLKPNCHNLKLLFFKCRNIKKKSFYNIDLSNIEIKIKDVVVARLGSDPEPFSLSEPDPGCFKVIDLSRTCFETRNLSNFRLYFVIWVCRIGTCAWPRTGPRRTLR